MIFSQMNSLILLRTDCKFSDSIDYQLEKKNLNYNFRMNGKEVT